MNNLWLLVRDDATLLHFGYSATTVTAKLPKNRGAVVEVAQFKCTIAAPQFVCSAQFCVGNTGIRVL